MKVLEATQWGQQLLEAAGIGEALLDARLLLAHALGRERSYLYSHPDEPLSPTQQQLFETYIEKRKGRIPLQHINGEQDFMGLTFRVSEDVLIPRQDTETLVEEALLELHDGMRVLDICTGSGCILLSLLHYSNDCRGVGLDISPKALRVAEDNARFLGIDNAEFVELDVMAPGIMDVDMPGEVSGIWQAGFDIICSNPPYIPTGDISSLMPEVRDHDPVIALDGGEDGLEFYRRIVPPSHRLLTRGGWLFLEIGMDQGEAVSRLMSDAGFSHISVVKDLAGLPRVVKGCK